MSYLHWTSELELGIKIIDEQHKRIVDYINLLQGAIELGDHADAVFIATKMVDYTCGHFGYEEALLKKANYLLTVPHIAVHERFKRNLKKLKDDIMHSEDMTAAKIMRSELIIWLTQHIQKEDADYVKSVNKLFHKESFFDNVANFFHHPSLGVS